MSLSQLKCVPCQGNVPAMLAGEINERLPEIPDWQVIEEEHVPRLQRVFKFKNFRQALDFTNQVGELAESQDHHPLIMTEYGKVTLRWWTHKIHGLHLNDFIMAARCDQIYGASQKSD
jgi:4a-hydroxytetrahydrobiopterin dehydratase